MSIKVKTIDGSFEYLLLLNGQPVKDAYLKIDPLTNKYFCEILNEQLGQEIIKIKLHDLLIFRQLKFNPLISLESGINLHLKINFNLISSESDFKDFPIFISLKPNLKSWNYSFSFEDYKNEFMFQVSKLKFVNNSENYVEKTNSRVRKISQSNQEINIDLITDIEIQNIGNYIEEFIDEFNYIDSNTFQSLIEKYTITSLSHNFIFPKEIKFPCEQYLLYFTRFLKDLGIEAASKLTDEAGRVLFSVTPTDDKEALVKIREALTVYLNLPASPIVYDDSFAAMRLKQQVDNLQHAQKMAEMEFRLATKVIESQDKTIQQKDLTIEQQSKIIEKITSKSIMIDSAENKEEFEEIYDGLKIGESKFLKEQLGIHLNPAKVIKTVVKNTFGKKENISIIDPKEKENN